MSVKAIQQFPQDFLWGCATAAHQVEGGNRNDWWRWEQTPGHIFQNQTADRACEWWNGRFIEDFDRAADLRNNAQRISVEWSRIEPEPGRWDEWALDRYREMLQALRERGMTPMVTLHHFTNPLWVADHDSWLWDEMPRRFEQFTRKVVEKLGDLCSLWCTINEPMVVATLGYLFGERPPGMRRMGAAAHAAANMLRAHAAAYHAIKELQPGAQVGYAMHYTGIQPDRPALIHGAAARMVDSFFNLAFNRAFLTGNLKLPGGRGASVPEVRGALDWLGVQYYQEFRAGFDPRAVGSLFVRYHKPTDMPTGPTVWGGLNPRAIGPIVNKMYRLLQKPIYITEAGVPDGDDTIRPGYLADTIDVLWHMVGFNIPVRGFFHWTLIDNFEWDKGYDPRFNFGLYHVQFDTQERIARPSAALFRDICANNGLSAEIVAQHVPDKLPALYPGEAGKNNIRPKAPKPVA